MIASWWAELPVLMKILWALTLSASLIFVIQSILTFIGLDHSGDLSDVDIPDSLDNLDGLDGAGHSGMNLYTFRNLVNFILGFGWTAILLRDKISSTSVLLFVSILVGVGLVVLVMYLFKLLNSMQQSGNINLHQSAVGCSGKVYLRIPGGRSGEGKVQISINGTTREYGAVTDGGELPTGASIKVVDVVDDETVLVESQESVIV